MLDGLQLRVPDDAEWLNGDAELIDARKFQLREGAGAARGRLVRRASAQARQIRKPDQVHARRSATSRNTEPDRTSNRPDHPEGIMADYQLSYPRTGSQLAFARAATALAVMSVGAFAIGALAVRWMAIKQLAVEGASIKRLHIGELEVDRLKVNETITQREGQE